MIADLLVLAALVLCALAILSPILLLIWRLHRLQRRFATHPTQEPTDHE